MQKEFSKEWISSVQPRKQRKFRYNAPMHIRRQMISAHLDKVLRKEYGRRSIPVRKGDEVKVVRGGFAGTVGKITRVDLKSLKIYLDNAKRAKVSGQEVEVAIDPSNVIVMKISLDDKKRKKFVTRKEAKKQEQPKKEKPVKK